MNDELDPQDAVEETEDEELDAAGMHIDGEEKVVDDDESPMEADM